MHQVSGGIALIEIIAACILAILLHEGSHTLAARLFGVALYAFRPSAIGIRAMLKSSPKSFKKQTLIFLSGPLGNFLMALLLWGSSGFLHTLAEASLAIGWYNLLPMYPLDGGQIFIIVFYKLMGSNKTFRLIKRISLMMKIILGLTGILQVLFFGNPSLLVAALMLPGTRLLEETVSMMKLENLLNRKQRIIKKGVYSARHLIVMEDCTLGDVIQKLDYDRFHILYVLNSDMEIIGQITEQQI
ncbi:MAG: hypothetical protein N2376_07105, partial [Clostridia bacterium]|nr:hypothetical protein [Clostridia bacterium]